ncbi:MAG: YkgJ family cysteine cluster protein [Candidatus Hodarchaeota archaeon]
MSDQRENEKRVEDLQTDETLKEDETDPRDSEATSKRIKYRFECQKTGQCCRSALLPVQVSLQDLKKWTEKGAIAAIFPNLSLKLEENRPPQLILQKYDSTDNLIDGCPMLDEENNLCKIYHSMPSWCEAFPLFYDGANFRIMDKTCPGIGKGEMSREKLERTRDCAKKSYEARLETNIILPTLSAIWSKSLIRAQAEALKNLSQEDRKSLEEILRKEKGTTN